MKYVGVKTTGELKLHEVKEPQTDEIYMAVEDTKLGAAPIRPYEFAKWDGTKWVKVDNVELATTLDIKDVEDEFAAIIPDDASDANKLATAADVAGVQEDVDSIEGKIPSDTSTTNKLVNESGLQDAIDNASESWSTGFTPKGESSVSDLNDLDTQSNGDSYIVTDPGTLTDGTLAVVAGDQVAWDATNSVWYKLPQYALKQFGTNEIHNLSQEATSFASGDFIAVSNTTNGARKMSKDALLELTAQNALNSISSLNDLADIFGTEAGRYIVVNTTSGPKKLAIAYIINAIKSIAPIFDPDKVAGPDGYSYHIDECVILNGSLYIFTANHTGAWSGSHARMATLEEIILKKFKDEGIDELLSYSVTVNKAGFGKFVKRIECYVPESVADHKFSIYTIGVLSNGAFALWLYDKTAGATSAYGLTATSYSTIPVSGVGELDFISYTQPDFFFRLTIDWSAYDDNSFFNNASSQVDVKVKSIKEYIPISTNNVVSVSDDRNCLKNSIFDAVKKFEVRASTTYSADDYEIRFFGFANSTTFYIGLWNKTDNAAAGLVSKTYDSIPTSGIEHIVLTESRFVYDLIIDWSKYKESYYISRGQNDSNPIKVKVLPLANQSLDGDDTELCGSGNSVRHNLFLSGTFVLNKAITMVSGVSIIGNGAVIKCGPNAKITMYDSNQIQGVQFVGEWAPTRTPYRSGYTPLTDTDELSAETNLFSSDGTEKKLIVMQSSYGFNNTIKNCSFKGFDCCCIYADGGAHQDQYNGILDGNYFFDCWLAMYLKGEFFRIVNNEFFRVVIGMYIYGGNESKVANVFKGCDCAILYSKDSTNGGHGEGCGIEAAHCNVAGIFLNKLAANCGDIYTGCQFVDAPIIGENVHSLLFSGCRLDTFFDIGSGEKNAIVGNIVGKSYTYGNNLYTLPIDSKVTLNTPINTATESDVNWT